MSVKLVAITESRVSNEEGKFLSIEEFVAFCARVSNPANQMNITTTLKLLNYLAANAHWSPFEMVSMTMEINTTRDISRQILRHRSFSFQEFSQRYAEATNFITNREARLQDKNNRQNSIEVDDIDLQSWFNVAQETVAQNSFSMYQQALEKGIAKEQARVLLPEGLTGTTLYMAGSLRSWIHYIALRASHGTQKEHMDIAKSCRNIILTEFPSLEKMLGGFSK